jgi:hypothetical protein
VLAPAGDTDTADSAMAAKAAAAAITGRFG